MKETALVIMAAGIGSRYGAGIKQLAKVGPSDEIIMDYSIHDALKAGFNKVIFIIRKDIEEEFKEVIGNRIEKVTEVKYAYQDLNDLPEGYKLPEGRTKPWGTGQAILAAADLIDCPFIVINADDYYGADGFKKVHDYLVEEHEAEEGKLDICMAGFVLGNTLSDNGTVARGVCKVADDGTLLSVTETFEIAERDGKVTGKVAGENVELSHNDVVSMNMWGITPELVQVLKDKFPVFLDGIKEGDLKAEYLLPTIIDDMIREGRAKVKVLSTNDKWYGVTYHEDREYVADAIAKMVEEGKYAKKLFA